MLFNTIAKSFLSIIIVSTTTFWAGASVFAQDTKDQARTLTSSNTSISPFKERGQYLVGPGDIFNLKVFDAKELSGKLSESL